MMKTKESAISFSSVNVREYNQILGDNPSCKKGAPLALGNVMVSSASMSVDEYEACKRLKSTSLSSSSSRTAGRRHRLKKLTKAQRRDILLDWNVSASAILAAEQKFNRTRRIRHTAVTTFRRITTRRNKASSSNNNNVTVQYPPRTNSSSSSESLSDEEFHHHRHNNDWVVPVARSHGTLAPSSPPMNPLLLEQKKRPSSLSNMSSELKRLSFSQSREELPDMLSGSEVFHRQQSPRKVLDSSGLDSNSTAARKNKAQIEFVPLNDTDEVLSPTNSTSDNQDGAASTTVRKEPSFVSIDESFLNMGLDGSSSSVVFSSNEDLPLLSTPFQSHSSNAATTRSSSTTTAFNLGDIPTPTKQQQAPSMPQRTASPIGKRILRRTSGLLFHLNHHHHHHHRYPADLAATSPTLTPNSTSSTCLSHSTDDGMERLPYVPSLLSGPAQRYSSSSSSLEDLIFKV